MNSANKLACLILGFSFIQVTWAEQKTDLVVPQPVMDYLLNCRQTKKAEELVPVLRTNIDVDGDMTSQQVSLLGLDELYTSLKSTIKSDDVTKGIIDRIRQELITSKPSFRTEFCPPTTTTLNVSVPPQELTLFNLRMERVLQQNNNIIIGYISNLIKTQLAPIMKILETLSQSVSQVQNSIVSLNTALKQTVPVSSQENFGVRDIPSATDAPLVEDTTTAETGTPEESNMAFSAEVTGTSDAQVNQEFIPTSSSESLHRNPSSSEKFLQSVGGIAEEEESSKHISGQANVHDMSNAAAGESYLSRLLLRMD